MVNRLIKKLEQFAALSESDRFALDSITSSARTKTVAPIEDIVRDGDRPSECSLILKGFACRYKLLPSGKRQIMSFHLPGDICDLHALMLGELDHSIGALEPTTVAVLPHTLLRDLIQHHPGIAQAFWQDTLIDSAVFREWMIGLGRRSAYKRIAHLFCELLVRFKSVGLAPNGSLDLPLTQEELGDALGLSTVHVNRVLQALRADGLIALQSGKLTINDWESLQEAGEFKPNYLHLPRGAPAQPTV
jgi:CRP-like cAMP-binding protein